MFEYLGVCMFIMLVVVVGFVYGNVLLVSGVNVIGV